MKIGIVTPSVSSKSGGIFEIQRRLAQELSLIPKTSVFVYGLEDDRTDADIAKWLPIVPKVYPSIGPQAFRYSPQLNSAIANADCDVLHLHVLWMATSLATLKWRRARKLPYVITINGMLEPWAMQHSAWKKKIAAFFFESRNLKSAACLIVNSENELSSVRNFGMKNPVAIIPNGVDLPAPESCDVAPQIISVLKDEATGIHEPSHQFRTLLFLGRIHPKKGLENLIRALAKLHQPMSADSLFSVKAGTPWRLVIAGWDELGHESELKRIATDMTLDWVDLRNEVTDGEIAASPLVFAGPKFGKEKSNLYRSCDAFILPSYSEGLPMAVLEAWSYGKPAVLTPYCNLEEAYSENAAIEIEPSSDSIEIGLAKLFSLTTLELEAMGKRGYELVNEKFNWPSVANKVRKVSEWSVSGGPVPDFVVFD